MKRNFLNLLSAILISLSVICCHQKNINPSLENTNAQADSAAQLVNYKDGQRLPNRLFPDKLRNIPNEITAAHYPNPCYAVYKDSMYIWKHNTTIQAKEDLQIVEYGSFVYTDKGWYLRVTLTPKDFEETYHCKDALLKKGVVYTDSSSWRRSKKLTGGDAMWYYIARDKNGRLVKGAAPIETENKLADSLTTTAAITSSNISWTGYGEIGGYSLTGSIKLKNADIEMSKKILKSADIIIDMASITHEQQKLEEHLKSEDFFDVAKYSTAEFVSDNIQYINVNNAIANGKLTIKGITKPFSLPLQITDAGKNVIVKSKILIDRTAYGIKFNSKSFFSNLGNQAIKNNFDLSFELKLN